MIGWYVHHHGMGHLQRLRAIAPNLSLPVTVFSSLPAPERLPGTASGPVDWVRLPGDADPEPGLPDPARADPTAGGVLHWAPLRHRGHARRLAQVAEAAPGLDGMVVDVSAEVVAFSRMLGLPTVAVTQPGNRTDAPHVLAYRLATGILAPFPGPEQCGEEALRRAAPHTLEFAEKTVFTGGISRLDAVPGDDVVVGSGSAEPGTNLPAGAEVAAADRGASGAGGSHPRVLFLGSAGGSAIGAEQVEAALTGAGPEAAAHWRVAGLPGYEWIEDVAGTMAEADVVVMNAGLGSLADAARIGVPAVLCPQDRPFGEQEASAALLEEAGGAVVVRGVPSPEDWTGLIRAALAAGTDPWRIWHADGAPQRAAVAIEEMLA